MTKRLTLFLLAVSGFLALAFTGYVVVEMIRIDREINAMQQAEYDGLLQSLLRHMEGLLQCPPEKH